MINEGIIAQAIVEALESSSVFGKEDEFDVLLVEGATSDTEFNLQVCPKNEPEKFECYRVSVRPLCDATEDEEDI